MKRAWALSLLCLCFRGAALCAPDSDSIVHRMEEVVVSAKRVSAGITSGRPVQMMDKEELRQLGLSNIADAVKGFAGANVKDYGGIGGIKTVSVRNLGAHHTAVSYDGITLSNTQAGQIDLGRYSLDNVQSLSLAVGEGDDIMQTARHRASAGVLGIETERPRFDEGRSSSFRFGMKGGAFGLANPSLRFWQKAGDSTSVALHGEYMRADGAYPFTLVNGIERTREKRRNSDIESWRGEANVYHNIKGGDIACKAYWFYSERGLPGSVVLYNRNASERLWDEDFFAQATLRKRIGEDWRLNACVKYTHSWNKYVDTDVKYQNGMQTEVNRQNECYASATIGWEPLRNTAFSVAQDLVYNDLSSSLGNSQQPRRYTSLTALAARYSGRRIGAWASLVGTLMNEVVGRGDAPAGRRRLSPALSLSYRLVPGEAFYVRAMYKSTFRVPTFNDMYYERVGTKSLRPEKADEINVGTTWQGRPFGFMKYMSATLDCYYNNVRDKIVAIPTMYVWKMANYGKVRMYGVDATCAAEMPLASGMSLVLAAAYSLQNCEDVTDKGSSTYGSQIPYTPRSTGNGSVVLRSPWVNVGYGVNYCGERYSVIQNTPEYRVGGYWEHSITLSREFRVRKCRINLHGTVSNLTNEQYEIIKFYPMPGRSWTVGIRIMNDE